MATWQFWTLFTVLVLIFLTLQSIHGAVKGLWTKLHELQALIGRIPGLDYRPDLERLSEGLGRVERSIDARTPDCNLD